MFISPVSQKCPGVVVIEIYQPRALGYKVLLYRRIIAGIFGTREIFRDSPFCNLYLINDYSS